RAWIRLYQSTLEESWLQKADDLMQIALEQFFDPNTETFFYTAHDAQKLVSRSRELADNVIPAANSVLAEDLFLLGTYWDREDYRRKSSRLTQKMLPQALENSPYFSYWGMLMLHHAYPPYEVAIVGENAENLRMEMAQEFLPQVLWLGGKAEGKVPLLEHKLVPEITRIYVCQDKICKFPVETAEEALSQLN
ncbi:MAG: thioredoxin domain-containing protein, partial [Bacteroidota bacterium]